MAKSIISNRHPVDKLADVRERIKALKDEEEALREEIMGGDFAGDEYVAQATESERSSLDRAKLEARFGKAAVAACCKTSTVTTLRLFKKAQSVR